ncbi:Wzz/FepE/Etk N-terminal domain-containing protein [Streptomyces sp. CA-294286]|uniref:Wzz/FepE/Etk N-terminal domain-containing protein n=1 Tax=Streptomyces sp. CA-294286 TaxID=3240070 RepID=UPI003D8CC2E4
MTDETIRLATIGRLVRRRLRLLAVLALVGALVGFGVSLLFPPRYTASASVLLAGQWEERALVTQAEIAASSAVVDRAAAALGPSGGGELRDRVSAETSDGNIVRIFGTADSPEGAQRLSDAVAEQFVAFAARIAGADGDVDAGPAALRQRVVQTDRRITELADAADPGRTVESVQARTELEKLRTALREAMRRLDETDPATRGAGLVVMGPAARPTGETPPTRIQLVGAGGVLFFVGGVVGHLVAARADRRLRGGQEVAAALGTTLLGAVEVPGGPGGPGPESGGRPAGLRRLLGVDTPWNAPGPRPSTDEADSVLRLRRVGARLLEGRPAPHRLLVVVPDGDRGARPAAERLVTEAGSVPASSSSHGERPVLRLVGVSVSAPVVPDRGAESGAVVVVGAGRWTAEELARIAGACADGGHEVVGAVVVGGRGDVPPPSAAPSREDSRASLAARGSTAGGTR